MEFRVNHEACLPSFGVAVPHTDLCVDCRVRESFVKMEQAHGARDSEVVGSRSTWEGEDGERRRDGVPLGDRFDSLPTPTKNLTAHEPKKKSNVHVQHEVISTAVQLL